MRTIGVGMHTDYAKLKTRNTGKSLRNASSKDISILQVKNTSLSFFFIYYNSLGNTTWLIDFPWPYSPDRWYATDLITTTQGTTPEGSQWAKINLPREANAQDQWAFKDLVEVPETLAPGDYVLSFRWDCQSSPQVWNGCSNIKIV